MPGDQFQDWVNNYTGDLLRWACKKLGDKEVAKDLVQDTFLIAWEQREKFEGRSHPKSWLTGILKNKISDHFRQRYKENSKQTSHPFFEADGNWKVNERPQAWPKDWEENCFDQSDFVSVWEICLGKLSTGWRIAISSKYLEEKETQSICQELGITPTNYWQMMHRAKLQLRKCLDLNWFSK